MDKGFAKNILAVLNEEEKKQFVNDMLEALEKEQKEDKNTCRSCEFCCLTENTCLIYKDKCYKNGECLHKNCNKYQAGAWS